MARLSVIVCDLCKKLNESLGHKLQLVSGRGDVKIAVKADICQECFDRLKLQVDSKVNLATLLLPPHGDVGAVVPSSASNLAASPRRAPSGPCKHSNTRFETPYIICLDCGTREST